jgi:predicted Zn finger-like uncharacterized protein
MNVTCDGCKTVFKVESARVPPEGIKVRCSKCQHVFDVKSEPPGDTLSEFEDFEKFHKERIEEVSTDVTEERPARIPDEPAGTSFEEFMKKEEPAQESETVESIVEEPISEEIDRGEWPTEPESELEEIDLEPSPSPEPTEVIVAPPEETPVAEEETALSLEAFLKEEIDQESAGKAGLPSLKDARLADLLKGKESEKGSRRRRPSSRPVLVLVLLLAIGVAIYFWWQKQGGSVDLVTNIGLSARSVVAKVSGLWEEVVGFRKQDLVLSGLKGTEDKIGQHRLYIIRGDVTNESKRALMYVKLRVVILDQAGNRIREKVLFAGNVFTRDELEKLAPRFLTGEETLQPKRPKDMVVEAGQTISFMAIFSGLPREGRSFKVEKLEAPAV